jgi:hypothetical protein
LFNNHNAIIYQLLKAFEVLKAKLVCLTAIVEYDIIFANITAKKSSGLKTAKNNLQMILNFKKL